MVFTLFVLFTFFSQFLASIVHACVGLRGRACLSAYRILSRISVLALLIVCGKQLRYKILRGYGFYIAYFLFFILLSAFEQRVGSCVTESSVADATFIKTWGCNYFVFKTYQVDMSSRLSFCTFYIYIPFIVTVLLPFWII